MVKATLNGTVLAESDSTVVTDLFTKSNTSTVCPWKGTASYYNATVGDNTVKDIAWYYPSTFEKAKNIEGYVAFYKNKATIE
ncbi:DUF427-domain-containing protein [Mycena olivaceomarginata]|nr:DUF427-domain-containing protein [Mycena olivaceomarginata]